MKGATGLSLTLKDERWRLIMHMNWKAQIVPVLLKGLPSKKCVPENDRTDWKSLPMPSVEEIRSISPYAQILLGNYRTPTFMVHGNRDDLIPWEQSQKTIEALRAQGVAVGIEVPDEAGHAFDLFPAEDRRGNGWKSIEAAYDFACRQLSMAH